MKKQVLMGSTFKNMRKTFQNITLEHIKRKEKNSTRGRTLKLVQSLKLKPLVIILFLCGAVFSAYSMLTTSKSIIPEQNTTTVKIENNDTLFANAAEYLSGLLRKIEKSGNAAIQNEWLKSTPPEIREEAETFLNNTPLSKLTCLNLSQNTANGIFTMICAAEKDSFKVKLKRNQDNSFKLVSIE